MTINTMLLITCFYIIPFIIILIGSYITFEGETLEEFKDHIFYMESDGLSLSYFLYAALPVVNIMVSIFFLFIGFIIIITLPFEYINNKLNIWNRIKKIKIKKHKWNI